MTAIAASFHTYRLLADDTLRAQIDFEPRDKDAALSIFRRTGAPLAVAGLVPDQPQPEPQPKGGELSKWVAMRCQEPEFQSWISEQAAGQIPPDKLAAVLVRALSEVQSRAEIDNDPAAQERFNARVRGPWMQREG